MPFSKTSHSQNFTCLAGRLGKITLYSGIEKCVKVLKETLLNIFTDFSETS
jgi:hypothetical protein